MLLRPVVIHRVRCSQEPVFAVGARLWLRLGHDRGVSTPMGAHLIRGHPLAKDTDILSMGMRSHSGSIHMD